MPIPVLLRLPVGFAYFAFVVIGFGRIEDPYDAAFPVMYSSLNFVEHGAGDLDDAFVDYPSLICYTSAAAMHKGRKRAYADLGGSGLCVTTINVAHAARRRLTLPGEWFAEARLSYLSWLQVLSKL